MGLRNKAQSDRFRETAVLTKFLLSETKLWGTNNVEGKTLRDYYRKAINSNFSSIRIFKLFAETNWKYMHTSTGFLYSIYNSIHLIVNFFCRALAEEFSDFQAWKEVVLFNKKMKE